MRFSVTSSARLASLRSCADMPVPHPARVSAAAATTDRAIHFRTRILRYVVYVHAIRQAFLRRPRTKPDSIAPLTTSCMVGRTRLPGSPLNWAWWGLGRVS